MSGILRFVRHRRFQPLWERAHRMAVVGMNYWASSFDGTGERQVLNQALGCLNDTRTPVIFDVGANLGEFTAACVEQLGADCRIFAFEPASATFFALQNRFRATPCVETIRCGVSRISGQAILHTSEPCSTIASLVELDRPIRPFDPALRETVDLCTIDQFCNDRGIERIHFLKIDIEGHELAALEGACGMLENGRIDNLQFEFGENNISSRTFLGDFVKLLGEYDLYRVVPGGLRPWTYQGGASEIFATMNFFGILRK